jgi:hypothetical protein
MRRLITFAIIALLGTACRAKESVCVTPSIEPVQALTTHQVGQLASHQMQSSGQHSAVLWSFDEEDLPRQGKKVALAFLLVSTGDIGGEPVGALIWTDRSLRAVLKPGTPNEFVVEFVDADRKCTETSTVIRVQADGTVMANSQRLGQLK